MRKVRLRQQEIRRAFDLAAHERGFVLDEAQDRAVERLSRLGAEVGIGGIGIGVLRPSPRGLYL
ncbi:hypothetical protein [Frankia sp. Cppng1_Ct_nod]|uniref:hypothetical protein n=1 Tax=Frankia sp. Cppng1_Ct_nod TaxID=2897162 RepID=UPI001A93D176|nr:hypothetical protein [Frankia sp. Cppng1_Ct_nod]